MKKVKLGFKEIEESKKPDQINSIFSSVSQKYDIMNDIMSFGLHRLWKKQFVRLCNIEKQNTVLDVACGTGDITLELLNRKSDLRVSCLDANSDMIQICKSRLVDKGYINNNYIVSGIEDFESEENFYDLITLAFGFRNFTDCSKALSKIFQLLRPGGSFLIMDFKKPSNNLYSNLFKFYTLQIIPKIGNLVADDSNSYKYLAESIQTYYTPDEVTSMFKSAGFVNVRLIHLPEDVVTIHIGYKA